MEWGLRLRDPEGCGFSSPAAHTRSWAPSTCGMDFRPAHPSCLPPGSPERTPSLLYAFGAVWVSTDAPPARALELTSHIFSAQHVWLARLHQQTQPFPVWPDFTLQQCEAQAAELPRLWQRYLNEAGEEGLASVIGMIMKRTLLLLSSATVLLLMLFQQPTISARILSQCWQH